LKLAGMEPKKSKPSPQCIEAVIKAHKGKRSLAWKGGRVKSNGYVLVWMPEHPNANKSSAKSFMRGKGGYIQEHRLVMSESIGRPLLPNENVHHKNGLRDDNRIENLELWTRAQPSGQRVEDKIEWAIKFLKEYGYATHRV